MTTKTSKATSAAVAAVPATASANTVIESIGVYLPPRAVSTRDILRACHHRLLYPLERLTGIKFRRMAGEKEFAIDLAANAIDICLKKSAYGPADVDLLICCNISRYDGPNFHFSFEPSTSVRLQHRFGMNNAVAFDISNACAGMFTGVYIANSFIKAGMIDRAMVVSGEYITHLTQTAQKEIEAYLDNRVACLTLGDSGAAMILERAPSNDVGFHEVDMFTLGRYSDLCIARPTHKPHGGAIMVTESVKLHAVAIKQSVQHIVQVLRRTNWPRDAFNYVIMHQTARTAITQTASLLNKLFRKEVLNKDNMINNLEERGNTSTTTHFVAVWDNILSGKIKSFDNVVFAIQASGITLGTAPYTFDDLPDRVRGQGKAQSLAKRSPAERKDGRLPRPMPPPRVRIESVGVVPPRWKFKRDAIALATVAGEQCLGASRYQREDIGVLIHTGVHRNDFISEPAIAALIAGELKLNDDIDSPTENRTFAYDIINGAMGFLNACCNATGLLRMQKHKAVMVVTSEIENNADILPEHVLGIKETGAAVTLDLTPEGDEGFGNFVFEYYHEHLDAFHSYIGQDRGNSYLSFIKDPELQRYYLDCIPKTVAKILRLEGLRLDDVAVVMPPQISPGFTARLAKRLGLPPARLVDVAAEGQDFYTSSLAYAFREARRTGRVKSGDIGLIINVGSGVQVGCATYYF